MNLVTELSNVASLLRWQNEGSAHAVAAAKSKLISRRLDQIAKSDPSIALRLRELVATTSDSTFRRVMNSPWMWNALFCRHGALADHLHQILLAAVNDQYARPSGGTTIFSTVDVCCDSPNLRGDIPQIPVGPDIPPTQHQLAATLSKILLAERIILRASAAAASLVGNCLSLVGIRQSTTQPRGAIFFSASTDIFSGLAVIENAHSSEVTPEQLADAIVHESIHSYFDLWQFYFPRLPHKLTPSRLRSPWSGRMLDQNTFVQACYIWFALVNFWTMHHRVAIETIESRRLLNLARSGLGSTEFYEAVVASELDGAIKAALLSLPYRTL